ncbi:unnamed protein product [Dovyalis caffra]|uniref:Uncharacterized protein n=1 Tax=Dovyalis caffra TaxID=77055 RepID=A0AAV1RNZ0_9ROSI|nr:unnamed protein product [Dovyalis caffra]
MESRRFNRNDGTSNSQPSSPRTENPDESKKVKITPLQLLEACWLDVTGSKTAIKGKTYEIIFKLSMNEEKSFGWYDPVSVMAKIGEEGEYKCVKVDLSQLGKDEKVFPLEKFEIEFKSDDNTVNNETELYFGLYEVWTNEWKGGLRIHEVIVQEVTAEGSASASNTRPEESEVVEVTADNSTSTSNNPYGQVHNSAGNSSRFCFYF